MTKNNTPPETSDLAGMAKKLEGESDRAVALIIAAWVDDSLGHLLKAYLVQDAKVIEHIFDGMAPLSSFSANQSVAYLVGLIDRKQFNNSRHHPRHPQRLAHSRTDLTFEDQRVRARCMNLMFRNMAEVSGEPRPPSDASLPSPRKAFAASGLILAGYFMELRAEKSNRLNRVAPRYLTIMSKSWRAPLRTWSYPRQSSRKLDRDFQIPRRPDSNLGTESGTESIEIYRKPA